jgi:hypothetical protein
MRRRARASKAWVWKRFLRVGQTSQLNDQLVGDGDAGQVAAHPSDVGDERRVLRIGPTLTAEHLGHAVHSPAGHVDDVLAAGQQHRYQQRCHRADQVNRLSHISRRHGRPGNKLLELPLTVTDLHRRPSASTAAA